MRKGIICSLLLISLLLMSDRLIADDCVSQNLFFPLGNGFSWSYKGIAVTDKGPVSFNSQATCTLAGSSSSLTGRIEEVFFGFPFELTQTTAVKLENGIIYSVEPSVQIKHPMKNGSSRSFDPSVSFQVYLPAMSQLAVGGGWTRSGSMAADYYADGKKFFSHGGTFSESETAEVVGTEKITVPAGTFITLKIKKISNATWAGRPNPPKEILTWLALGVGLVKEEATDGSSVKELTAYRVKPCCGFMVMSMSGAATINGNQAAQGQGAPADSKVSVPAGGSLDLAMGDGSLIKIGPQTDLDLKQICDKVDELANRPLLNMIRGKINVFFTKTFTPNPRILINTPTATVGVRGTEFSLEVKEEAGRAQTIIEVLSGEVWVKRKSDNQEVILQAGAKQVFE